MQNIFVPVDFHKHTDGLVAFAINITNKLEGKITFLHVAESVAGGGGDYPDAYPATFSAVNDELFAQAQRNMTALVERSKDACPGCSGVVVKGDVVETLVEYAKDKNCDMIIIGTHGYKGIQKILLGSVADRVLKRAPCPILIFNPYKGERS